MKKAALHNLGCKVNTYETDAMRQNLMENGYEIVPFDVGADIYIINTCTVTNIADRKSRQMLHKAKKMNEDAVVVATGCYVQAAGEEILKDDAIDIVIGNNNKGKIVEILEEYFRDNERKKSQAFIDDLSKPSEYEDMNMTTVTEHTRAFIKIQDGCNQFCTYCIIPYARGRIRSRKLSDVIREVTSLTEAGYSEFVLTGIHLSSYGKDQLELNIGLIDAIERVAFINGVERVRLGSLEPMIITEEFMDRVSKIPQFCPHFHLSLQSGCDNTLKRMNRHYTADMYYEKCCLIRKVFPKAAITTDVIVGFPGETEDDFIESKNFLEKVQFAEMHIFKYSVRKGTAAEKMPDQVNDKIKTVRSDILLELNKKMNKEYRELFLGTADEILLEEDINLKNSIYQVGYTKEYIKVAIPREEDMSGKIIKVNIKEDIGEILLAETVKVY